MADVSRRRYLGGAAAALGGLLAAACGEVEVRYVQGPPGPPGPAGPQGEKGAAGPRGEKGAAGKAGKAVIVEKKVEVPVPAKAPAPIKLGYLRYYGQKNRIKAEQAIFKQLAEKHPGLVVDELTVAGVRKMIEKMTAFYVAGNPPDTWTTAPTVYHEYVRRGNLLRLDSYIKRDLDPKKLFMGTMKEWESPAASGKHYGITRDFVVTLLYYNKGMFDAAQIPYPDASWSYETVEQLGPKFAHNQDSGDKSTWAFTATSGHNSWDAAVRANGGKVLNERRTRAVMDASKEALATTDQWIAWNQQLRISPPPGHEFYKSYRGLSFRNAFFSGRVALYQSLTGLIPRILAAQKGGSLLKWDVTVVPKGKARREAYGGPDGQVISKASKHPDIAWEMMLLFLTPESLPFHLAWGGIPFSREVTALPKWQDREPKGSTKVMLDSAEFFSAEFNMNYSNWQRAKRKVLNEAFQGKIGSREAIRRVAEEVNKILTKAYPQP